MPEFALIVNNVFSETRFYDERPGNINHKSIVWYPVVREEGNTSFWGVEGDNYVFRDPVVVAVPAIISDRQFFQQLAVMGIITAQEAEDAMASVIPAAMLELVEMLPEPARFPSRMLLKGAVEFHRHHELTDTLAWMYGWTSEQIDELFIAASAL